MKNEVVLILDFGGQYNQLIARRVRECNVYSEVVPYNIPIEKVKEYNPKGIIFTGGPANLSGGPGALMCEKEIFELGIPILGICYGMQLMTHVLGGEIGRANTREYGVTNVELNNNGLLFQGVEETNPCLMSHGDYVAKVPEGFGITGKTPTCPIAAMENKDKKFYGIQFHPEVNHTKKGTEIIKNFLYNICECSGDWKMSSFTKEYIAAIKEKVRRQENIMCFIRRCRFFCCSSNVK
jgi:GMP synthase (glutamine-hydrolysing)